MGVVAIAVNDPSDCGRRTVNATCPEPATRQRTIVPADGARNTTPGWPTVSWLRVQPVATHCWYDCGPPVSENGGPMVMTAACATGTTSNRSATAMLRRIQDDTAGHVSAEAVNQRRSSPGGDG